MANLGEVPVVDVQTDNIQELWPTLLLAVRTSAFVAIDTELSGLGNRRQLNAKNLDDRYEALVNISKTRSILSVGLSCFRLEKSGEVHTPITEDAPSPDKPQTGLKFVSQTFNILVLCSEEYVVEPLSLQFLVNHNFDFNRQYAKGIPYYRGPDQDKPKHRQWFRELLVELTTHRIPVVFHNAFVDLGFLYQSFHTALPSTIGAFLADLTEVFPGGVFDTKYITEFRARFPASYLEYVFRKCQRDNQDSCDKDKPYVSIGTLTYPAGCAYITYLPCNILSPTHQQKELCQTYAAHGWCGAGVHCTKSHDIDLILDADDKNLPSKRKRRKRKAKQDEDLAPADTSGQQKAKQAEDSMSTNGQEAMGVSVGEDQSVTAEVNEPETPKPNTSRTEGHRAGFDSFMTGFIFACFAHKFGAETTDMGDLGMWDFVNKVALSGKDIPLRVVQGNFVKTSKDHRVKMEKAEAMVT